MPDDNAEAEKALYRALEQERAKPKAMLVDIIIRIQEHGEPEEAYEVKLEGVPVDKAIKVPTVGGIVGDFLKSRTGDFDGIAKGTAIING